MAKLWRERNRPMPYPIIINRNSSVPKSLENVQKGPSLVDMMVEAPLFSKGIAEVLISGISAIPLVD